MPLPLEQLQANLADAQAKYHQLMTGRLSVEVAVDGYQVKYTRTNIADLRTYIADLEAQIAGRPSGAGAIVVVF